MNDLISRNDCWIGKGGLKGKSFSLEGLDLEATRESKIENLLSSLLLSLNENTRIKISLFKDFSREDKGGIRCEDIKERGFIKTYRFIHFEDKRQIPFLKAVLKREEFKDFSELDSNINKEVLRDLGAKNIKVQDFLKFYNLEKPFQVYPVGLKTKTDLISILKLKSPSSYPLSLKTLALKLKEIPKPFEFHIGIERLSLFESEKILKHKTLIEKEGKGQVSFERYKEAELLSRDIALKGENLFRYDIHIVLRRKREKYLAQDIEVTRRVLSSLGDFSLESFGSIPALNSIRPGGNGNLPFFEVGETLKYFLPLMSFGKSSLKEKKGLFYHRSDLSLDVFNPYNKNYANYSGVIIGKSGKGKSVFTNLLTKSLFSDSKNHIFLIDVKGSHKRLIHSLKGSLFNIDIKNPSGLSPMSHLKDDKINIEILSHFLETLLLDKKESSLPSVERINLERSLIQFSKSGDLKTLYNFYKVFKSERKIELSKWVKGGLNEFIFKESKKSEDRLCYYNFENISTASDSQMARAIISSILAEFQFKLLNKKEDERFFLICDETPFFIKNSFSTFSLLSKNVRKLNGSLILIAQNSKDLIVNKDTSLIDNSEFKILFSTDGEERKFKEVFSLDESEFLKVKNLQTIKNQFSSFLIKDSLASKVGFLRLSKLEFMTSNTEPDFLFKTKKLKELLKISEDKVLKLMSYV